MPLVRVSLPYQISSEEKESISQSVHKALVKEFHIPENDYFQIIEELKPHQIKYPKQFLGIEHTAELVYIQIIVAKDRGLLQKEKLYKEIAQQISAKTTITKNNIIIVLLENGTAQNWSLGNGVIPNLTHLS